MVYYSLLSVTGERKNIAIPSSEFLEIAKVLAFRNKTKGLPYLMESDGFVLNESQAGNDLHKVVSATEISQSKYRQATGTSYLDSGYAKKKNIFKGTMPEDWREKAMSVLVSGTWQDQFGRNDDIAKLVDGQIDNLSLLSLMWEHMTALDPILMLEAYDRWLYGEAIAVERPTKKETEFFSFIVDCQYKVWERHFVTVEATDYEVAKQRVIEMAKNHPVSMDDGLPGMEISFETLSETEELIDPVPGGEGTVQVMTDAPVHNREILYDNAVNSCD